MAPAELFPADVGQMDSPRVAWLKKHGIITYRCTTPPFEWLAGMAGHKFAESNPEDWFFEETSEWGDSRIGTGETEDDALADLAKNRGIRLWNEEGAT